MTKRKMSQDYYQEMLYMQKSAKRSIAIASVLLGLVVIIVGVMFFFDTANFTYGSYVFGGCIIVAIACVAALYLNINKNVETTRLIADYELRESSRKKRKK